jgi:hypothetical protein
VKREQKIVWPGDVGPGVVRPGVVVPGVVGPGIVWPNIKLNINVNAYVMYKSKPTFGLLFNTVNFINILLLTKNVLGYILRC